MGLLDDYEVPSAEGGYMRFEQGENKFRVMSEPIMGEEFWKEVDGKRTPVRFKPDEPIKIEEVDPDTRKHFWAMVVWNYKAKKLQILEITQKTIQQAIKAYDRNDDFGDFREYDLTVTRTGEGLKTEYQVMASPPKKVDDEIQKAYKNATINLSALYDGENPFGDDIWAKVAEEME